MPISLLQLPTNPAFSIASTVSQSFSASTATKVVFDSLNPSFDTHGFWSVANNWYKPTIPGKYMFYASLQSGVAINAGEYWQPGIAVNGTQLHTPFMYSGSANQQTFPFCWLVDLDGVVDFVECYITTSRASPSTNGKLFFGFRVGN